MQWLELEFARLALDKFAEHTDTFGVFKLGGLNKIQVGSRPLKLC